MYHNTHSIVQFNKSRKVILNFIEFQYTHWLTFGQTENVNLMRDNKFAKSWHFASRNVFLILWFMKVKQKPVHNQKQSPSTGHQGKGQWALGTRAGYRLLNRIPILILWLKRRSFHLGTRHSQAATVGQFVTKTVVWLK